MVSMHVNEVLLHVLWNSFNQISPQDAVSNHKYIDISLHKTYYALYTGAGKTTTFSILTGDLSPSDGTAFISGYDIRTDIRHVCTYVLASTN